MGDDKKSLRGLIKKIHEKGFIGWKIERLCPKSKRDSKTFNIYDVNIRSPNGFLYNKFGLEEEQYSEFDVALQKEKDSASQILDMIEKDYFSRRA